MSFLPLLSKIVPEAISKMEKGRYYRNRFVAISEVSLVKYRDILGGGLEQICFLKIHFYNNSCFQKWIKEHKEDYRGNRTGDLQDAYLEKIKEGCEGFSENDLSAMLRELFVIGAESESVMLRYISCILIIESTRAHF